MRLTTVLNTSKEKIDRWTGMTKTGAALLADSAETGEERSAADRAVALHARSVPLITEIELERDRQILGVLSL
jgi:hypothetical protein